MEPTTYLIKSAAILAMFYLIYIDIPAEGNAL